MSFFKSLTAAINFASARMHNDSLNRYYQTEFPREEGRRLYAEYLRTGRIR